MKKGEKRMKKIYVCLLSFASLNFVSDAFAEETSQAQVSLPPSASNFTSAQREEIEKIATEYLAKHPDVITNALQAAMIKQQQEEIAKIEKAVAENKDKIFKDAADPVGGNPKGTQSLVVFLDPYCGYCKKMHGELDTLLKTNKNVKVVFKDLPIMGQGSLMAVKAMLAAKEQGKYDQLQAAIFSSDKHLTKKQILKIASSLGIDVKKLEEDMKSKALQARIDQGLELAKALGIDKTPTLIIGETKVLPGYVTAEELDKKLKDIAKSPSAAQQEVSKKAS